jgi:uncharacterized RDD family membrane protein YckC
MTEPSTPTQPPGWYHAEGDPPGTQRYWDGAQWQGGPQPVPSAPLDSGGGTWGVAAPGAGAAVIGPPRADYGQRVVAYLIDVGIGIGLYVAGFILVAIMGSIADFLGGLMTLVTVVVYIAYFVWNFILQQGRTGQTIGKKQQGIKLVSDESGQPVGGVMAFVRYLVWSAIGSVTCGVYTLLDVLWPLWDADRKRLTDKMLKFSVVKA